MLYDAPSAQGASRCSCSAATRRSRCIVNVEGWIKVRDVGGTIGWIDTQGRSATSACCVVRVADGRRARQSRRQRAARVPGRAERAARARRAARHVATATPGWVKVRHRDGQTGYVRIAQVFGPVAAVRARSRTAPTRGMTTRSRSSAPAHGAPRSPCHLARARRGAARSRCGRAMPAQARAMAAARENARYLPGVALAATRSPSPHDLVAAAAALDLLIVATPIAALARRRARRLPPPARARRWSGCRKGFVADAGAARRRRARAPGASRRAGRRRSA